MKPLLICLVLLVSLAAQAQPSKTQAAVNDVRKTAIDVKSVVSLGSELKGLFPKKKAKAKEAETVVPPKPVVDTAKVTNDLKTTLVVIYGIDYAKLKSFNENIKACMGVESTEMKYSSTGSTIKVMHKGNTESLLKLMGETSKDIFSDKNITSFEEGNIALKL